MPAKRKILFGVFSLLFLVWITKTGGMGTLGLFETARAADAVDPFFNVIDQFFSWVAVFAHFLIYVLTAICGMLLDPSFMNLHTDSQSMGSVLIRIWQISRNITNIILAFLLIIGAVMTVVFAAGSYVQQYAVKFVIAVILVNFSWFFPRVVLDLANILTATVYSLPSAINVPCVAHLKDGKIDNTGCKVVTGYAFFESKEKVPAGMTCPIFFGGQKIICIREEPLEAGANTPNAIMGAMVYNHARFKFYEQVVKPTDEDAPGAGLSPLSRLPQLLLFTLMLSIMLFFSLALLFPLLALTLVLLIRIPIIWITVAFMPFMFIGYVAGDTAALKAFNPMEIWNKFLHAAFIPVVTAIPFSIGFIMINVAMANPPLDNETLTKEMGMPMLPGVVTLWQLIWVGMSIAVVWMGAKAAFKMDTLFEKFASPIMSAGGSVGKLMMKLPLLLPLPLPGAPGAWKDLNIGQALNIAKAPDQLLAPKFYLPPLGGGAGAGAGRAVAVSGTEATKHLEDRLAKNSAVEKEQLSRINRSLEDLKNAKDQAGERAATQRLRTHINEVLAQENKQFAGSTGELKDVVKSLRTSPKLSAQGMTIVDVDDAKFKD